jgi:plastocyanin
MPNIGKGTVGAGSVASRVRRSKVGARLVAALIATALLASLGLGVLGTAFAQTAAQTWDVQVGLDVPAAGGPEGIYSTQAYGPDPVIIRAGDTVRWTFAGFHTVTFWNGHQPQREIAPGPNPGELMLTEAFFGNTPIDRVATFDPSRIINTGVPMGDEGPGQAPPTFSMVFPATGLFGYVCVLHPGMRGTVEVREANATLPETPAQARARGQNTLNALISKIQTQVSQLRPTSAGGVHAVLNGVGDAFGVSALMFAPGEIHVSRGDTVVWTLQDPFEIHTVTFTSGAQPPEFVDVRPQPQGPPQLVIPANVVAPQGGNVYMGQGYINSGIMTPGDSFILRFDAPAGSYDYLCVIHPFMRGRVTIH